MYFNNIFTRFYANHNLIRQIYRTLLHLHILHLQTYSSYDINKVEIQDFSTENNIRCYQLTIRQLSIMEIVRRTILLNLLNFIRNVINIEKTFRFMKLEDIYSIAQLSNVLYYYLIIQLLKMSFDKMKITGIVSEFNVMVTLNFKIKNYFIQNFFLWNDCRIK